MRDQYKNGAISRYNVAKAEALAEKTVGEEDVYLA